MATTTDTAVAAGPRRRVFIAGHSGMVGAALVRRLQREACDILTVPHSQLDLRRQADVEAWMEAARPDEVYVAAGTVGGILANSTRPAEFLYDNLAIHTNVIHAAWRSRVRKLLYLGSSCIYPRLAPQPIAEEALLTGPLEPSNQWYAIAKIAGIKMCQAYRQQYGCDFISAMPTNLYGPGDRFDVTSGHVLPALMRRIHEAKVAGAPSVTVWGTGSPRREFLHADDLADACVFLMRTYSGDIPHNVGTGRDMTIRELVAIISEIVGYHGVPAFDATFTDGTPRKQLEVGRLERLGWRARIELCRGIEETYAWFLAHVAAGSEPSR